MEILGNVMLACYNKGMITNNNQRLTAKKIGRRKAGSYGRPGSKKLKRIASKAARKFLKEKNGKTS